MVWLERHKSMADDYHPEYEDVEPGRPGRTTTRRSVPLSAWLAVRFGHPLAYVGWLVFGFTMIFGWLILSSVDLSFGLAFSGDPATAEGEVIASRSANMEINGRSVYRVEYRFTGPQGQTRRGRSYGYANPEPGTPVTVEFPPDDPDTSRIQGMTTRPAPAWLLAFLVFPLVGWILVLVSWFLSSRRLHVLRCGQLTHGRLIKTEPTSTRINNQRVYKYTFGFLDHQGSEQEAVCKTHKPERIRDDELEPILYDPDRPWKSALVDDLPAGVGLDPQTDAILRPELWRIVLPVLIVTVVILGHGIYMLAWLF